MEKKKLFIEFAVSIFINVLLGIILFGILRTIFILTGDGGEVTRTQDLLILAITMIIMCFIWLLEAILDKTN